MRRLAILGSTGSIGVQALGIAERWSGLFEVATLTSNNNWQLLAGQALKFLPDCVAIANPEHYPALRDALADSPVKVYAGAEAVSEAAALDNPDIVLNAIVGFAGLAPTLKALRSGKPVALANKESLVVAGGTVMKLSADNRAPIIPVDSEHSAIFQCLAGEASPASKVILTASGGPFLNLTHRQMASVTPEQALRHPRWNMGAKITVDSASMMNKGFEVIEAKHLFGLRHSQIEVIVHPQSIIHSLVEFPDGAIKAQLGHPDMRIPIQYALTHPSRLPLKAGKFSLPDLGRFTFEPVDPEQFPNLGIAYEAMKREGNSCCVLNGANEAAVAAFLEGRIAFTDITEIIEKTLGNATFVAAPSENDYYETDAEARRLAAALIKKKQS